MNELRMLLWATSSVAAVVLALAPGASGTPEMADREGRNCVTCHTAVGRPELNDIGDYYKENGTLEGYPGELPPREGEPEPEPDPEPGPEQPQLRLLWSSEAGHKLKS